MEGGANYPKVLVDPKSTFEKETKALRNSLIHAIEPCSIGGKCILFHLHFSLASRSAHCITPICSPEDFLKNAPGVDYAPAYG